MSSELPKKYQVYLIGYSHEKGMGRVFNYRTDGQPPSVEDIESIERRQGSICNNVCIISVSRLADSDEVPQWLAC